MARVYWSTAFWKSLDATASLPSVLWCSAFLADSELVATPTEGMAGVLGRATVLEVEGIGTDRAGVIEADGSWDTDTEIWGESGRA